MGFFQWGNTSFCMLFDFSQEVLEGFWFFLCLHSLHSLHTICLELFWKHRKSYKTCAFKSFQQKEKSLKTSPNKLFEEKWYLDECLEGQGRRDRTGKDGESGSCNIPHYGRSRQSWGHLAGHSLQFPHSSDRKPRPRNIKPLAQSRKAGWRQRRMEPRTLLPSVFPFMFCFSTFPFISQVFFFFWKFLNLQKSWKNCKMNTHGPSLRFTKWYYFPLVCFVFLSKYLLFPPLWSIGK